MRKAFRVILISFLLFLPVILVSNLGYIHVEYLSIILNQVINTVTIIFFVVTITTIIGSVSAWLFAMYEFPFKKFLEIILILGMVFPSYVLAFFYSETFNVFGSVALVATMVVATIPYVFMIVTMSLRSQSQQLVESALMLGKDSRWVKQKVILPLIKPAIILSSLLVLGDTFSEFGATYFYGVDTIMTGIYEIWFSLHETEQGIRLAAWTFVIIVTIYYFINVWKHSVIGQKQTLSNSGNSKHIQPQPISKLSGWMITCVMLLLTTITFFIPMGVLSLWVIDAYTETDWWRILLVTFNSTVLASIISLFVIIFTTLVLYLFKKRTASILALSNALYSTPGIVLAIAVVFVLELTSIELIGVIFIYVLVLKYLAMGTDSIGVGIQKVNRQYYHTAKTLGKTSSWYVWMVQIPMSVQSYLIAGILVWIDVIRELVIGLTLRPHWLELLSVEIFRYMDMEVLYMSGPWILAMVIITIIPIIYINSVIKQKM